jgi:small subunit ribosomal protein S11
MAYNRRKRKIKKNIPEGQAHIHCTYNNTVVSITDLNGNAISWASAGTIGYKGSKKKTPFAAGMSAEAAAKTAMDSGVKKVKYSLLA